MPNSPIYPVAGDAEGDAVNAELLDGQEGAFYQARANHTGAQAISTVTGLQAELDSKLASADFDPTKLLISQILI
jgi:hypothetical protein